MKRTILFSLLIAAVAVSFVVGVGFPLDQQGTVDDGGNGPRHIQEQQANQKEAGKADDEKMPESWRGTWKVTVAYRDHTTGALVSTDIITDEICPGELIVSDLVIKSLKCSTNAEDNEIGALCSGKYSPRPGCNVFVNADLDSQRDGETWRVNEAQ